MRRRAIELFFGRQNFRACVLARTHDVLREVYEIAPAAILKGLPELLGCASLTKGSSCLRNAFTDSRFDDAVGLVTLGIETVDLKLFRISGL